MPAQPQPLPAFGPLGGVRYRVAGVDLDMVKLPPGRFMDGEGAGRRELLVSRPFELGMTLVTQALWRAVMRDEPSIGIYDLPLNHVSWNGVQDFLARLQELGFSGFRLPTEAEWAWAARCGAPTRWAGADRVRLAAVVAGARQEAPVAGLLPSASGVFDASGNLWEWQQDAWLRAPAPGVDAQGSSSGSVRVYRGGGWTSTPSSAQVNYRVDCRANIRGDDLGFRLVRSTP